MVRDSFLLIATVARKSATSQLNRDGVVKRSRPRSWETSFGLLVEPMEGILPTLNDRLLAGVVGFDSDVAT